MKTKGRKKSTNIEDRRAKFGSFSITEPRNNRDRIETFFADSINRASKPTKKQNYNSFINPPIPKTKKKKRKKK